MRQGRGAPGEAGFSLIEVVVAAVIFLIVATALTGVLTSAIASHTVSRERTKGVQLAQDQLERISNLAYADVGVSGGYPSGVIPAAGWSVPAGYTVAISVVYVNDPGPTSSRAVANYKRVTVVVSRTNDGKVLTTQSTYVSPPSRPQYGGINTANLTVTVSDYGTNAPLPGATVSLANGPAGNVSLVTDVSGQAPFLALPPTTTPPTDYYDVTATKTGYETLAADLPPSGAAHLTLAPTQSRSTTIRVFKRATIYVNLTDASNAPYTGAATMKIKSASTGAWTTFTTTNGTFPAIDTLGSNPVLPNVLYTVRVFTPTGLCSGDTQKNVPDNYPTTLTTTYDMQLTTCPSGTVHVNVKQLGLNVVGGNVTLTGGPYGVNVSGTTDANGDVVFTSVPSHATDDYTVTASRTVQGTTYTQTGTTLVSTGGTANVNLVLPSPALATVNVTVNVVGVPQSGATVVLSGSPFGLPDLTGTTDATGVATFTSIPVGTGYTATASLAPYANGSTTFAVVSPTTNATVAMPAGTLTVNTSWAGQPAASASVSVTDGTNTYTGTTNAGGTATITVPTGTWNVTVTKNGFSGTGSATVTTGGGTVTVSNFPTGTLTVNATWASLYAGSAAVSITGGANNGATYTGTTAVGTGVLTIVVPPTATGFPYAVSVSKNGGTGSASVVTLAPSGTATANVALTPTKTFTITIQRGGVAAASTSINLSITGGPNGTAGAAPAYTFTVTTNGSGVLPAVTVPRGTSGSTYTIKANLTTCGASGSNRSGQKTAQSNIGTNTAVTINMTTTTCPFSPLP